MTVQNESGAIARLAGEALEPYRRVKVNGTTAQSVVYADGGEASMGVTSTRATSIGDSVSVRLWTASGTFEVEAAGAITQNAEVYGADDGKIQTAASGTGIGWADEVAAADGDVINMVKMQSAEA